MKILHIVIGLDVGGAEMMLKRLVTSYCGDSRFNHVVISLTGLGTIGPQLQARGIQVYALNMNTVVGFLLAFIRLFFLVRKIRPDIVQTWMYHADLLGGIVAKLALSCPVIWGVRTTDIKNLSHNTLFVQRLCAYISSFVPDIISCPAEAARKSHVSIGYAAHKMRVVPNGYDFSWLQATMADRLSIRKNCGISADAMVVGSLGRFHDVKNHENFVKAMGKLAPRYPQLMVLMVGRGVERNNAELWNWIVNTGFSERFVLLGERSDVPQCLSAMDIFCLHSRSEAFPNVLAEAMAMGLPCVATDVGDAALLLGGEGRVVVKEDSSALAAAVEDLILLDTAARMSIGQRAKDRIVSSYSMEAVRSKFESLYHQLTGK